MDLSAEKTGRPRAPGLSCITEKKGGGGDFEVAELFLGTNVGAWGEAIGPPASSVMGTLLSVLWRKARKIPHPRRTGHYIPVTVPPGDAPCRHTGAHSGGSSRTWRPVGIQMDRRGAFHTRDYFF